MKNSERAMAYRPDRLARAFAVYMPHLDACMRELPDHYAPSVKAKGAPEVATDMFQRIREKGLRSIMIDPAPAWTRTCKTLGIKRTYKAIEAWLSGEDAWPSPTSSTR